MFDLWGWREWIGSALVVTIALRTAYKFGCYQTMERLGVLPSDHTRRDRREAMERLRKLR